MALVKPDNTPEWWNQRYEPHPFLFGKAPSPFLVDSLNQLKTGTAIEFGCGEGRNIVFLAQKGFRAIGRDFSSIAIQRATELARDVGVTVDLKTTSLAMFVMPLMEYDTIVLIDIMPPLTVLKSLAKGLNKNGTLLVEAYTTAELKAGSTAIEPFECFQPNQVLTEIRGLHLLYYDERVTDRRHKVRAIAKKIL